MAHEGMVTFEHFFRDEYPRLVPMLHALTGDRQRAEDIAQEALATAQRDWERVRALDRPGAWVRRVALNASSNVRRRRSREVVALQRLASVPASGRGAAGGRSRALAARPPPPRATALGRRPALRRGSPGRRGGRRARLLGGHREDAPLTSVGDARPTTRRHPQGGDVMNDPELRLRDAGAHLRTTAPTRQATDAALASLGDIVLDDPDSHRSRRWIIGPAVLAAAAAIIGVVVVTRPDEAAIVPADTTTVSASTVPPPSPAPTTPAPTVAPATTTATAPPAPTTSAPTGTDLGFGVTLTTSDADFDGSGGACLTLSTATDTVSGCADGATIGSAYGQPLALRLDGTLTRSSRAAPPAPASRSCSAATPPSAPASPPPSSRAPSSRRRHVTAMASASSACCRRHPTGRSPGRPRGPRMSPRSTCSPRRPTSGRARSVRHDPSRRSHA